LSLTLAMVEQDPSLRVPDRPPADPYGRKRTVIARSRLATKQSRGAARCLWPWIATPPKPSAKAGGRLAMTGFIGRAKQHFPIFVMPPPVRGV
jgi:hypothetical protein